MMFNIEYINKFQKNLKNMKNKITPNNISTILLRKTKNLFSDNTQNKSTNTLITDLINSNQRFMNKKSNETIDSKKYIYPYFLVKSRQRNYEIKNIKPRYNKYILPVISNKNNIFNSINNTKQENNNSFRHSKIQNKKINDILINPVLLYLNTESNDNKEKNKKIIFNSKEKDKGNKIKDDFLERVKDYRNRLKEQMIKRNKFQYSHSNNSLNRSQNKKNEKEIYKEIRTEKENDENRFNFNSTNRYIFKMNENVDKSLNIFYNKLRSTRILRYKRDKSLINYSNLNSDRNLSTKNKNEILQNKFYTINIK